VAKLTYQNKAKGKYARLAVGIEGKRQYVNIGYSSTQKDQKRDHRYLELVDDLETLKAAGLRIDAKTKSDLAILQEKNPQFVQRLLKAGLLKETRSRRTLKQLFDEHFQSKLGVNKDRSCRNYRQAQKVFEDYVGGETLIADVTAGDVENFISEMKREGRESSTIGNYLKRTRQAFQYAADHEWIEKNPIQYSGKDFKIVKTTSKQKIQEKLVTPETIEHLLNEPLTFEFKLLLNVVRWTGCRIGEALILRWDDVSFDEDDPRIELREKDTAHSGVDRSKNPTRTVPLFTELRPVLEQARELAAEDDEYVFNELGDLRKKPDFELANENGQRVREGRYETNVGGHLTRAIRRAGLEIWPQPWHAIRDFRLNELSRLGYRQAEISVWCGNSESVRQRHYGATAVTAADRRKAAGAQPESAGAQIVLNSDAQIDLNQIVELALEDPESRVLLEKLLIRLSQADSRFPENWGKYTREGSNLQPPVPKTGADCSQSQPDIELPECAESGRPYVCPSDQKAEHESAPGLTVEPDLDAALAMIERLPLSDDQKAEAVRRLLGSK
jgi:integrase